MTKTVEDNGLVDVWAEDGAVQAPDSSKINIGWLSGERPAFQSVNWFFNLVQKSLNYLRRRGVPDWSSDITYEAGDVVNSAGVLYVALEQSTDSEPPSSDWKGVADFSGNIDFSGNNAFTGNNSFSAKLALKSAGALAIDSGAITITGANHLIDAESGTSDTLETIGGGVDGEMVVVRAGDGHAVTLTTSGNIITQDGNDLDLSGGQRALLQYDGALSKFVVVAGPSAGGELPLGTVYINHDDSTNPATLLGYGTWVALQDRMLIGAGGSYTAGATGGSATTTQSSSQLASHYHYLYGDGPGSSWGASLSQVGQSRNGNPTRTQNQGSGSPMTTISPYLGVYMWRRAA